MANCTQESCGIRQLLSPGRWQLQIKRDRNAEPAQGAHWRVAGASLLQKGRNQRPVSKDNGEDGMEKMEKPPKPVAFFFPSYSIQAMSLGPGTTYSGRRSSSLSLLASVAVSIRH